MNVGWRQILSLPLIFILLTLNVVVHINHRHAQSHTGSSISEQKTENHAGPLSNVNTRICIACMFLFSHIGPELATIKFSVDPKATPVGFEDTIALSVALKTYYNLRAPPA